MFSYTIEKSASARAFAKACRLIESNFSGISKEPLLEDVDGTTIQIYRNNGKKIKVCNDYEVDAVYIDSEIELKNII